MNYVLYNPVSGKFKGTKEALASLEQVFAPSDYEFVNICDIKDHNAFFASADANADVILCGGDGTLNRFINAIDGIAYTQRLLYYPFGSGNDFMRDVELAGEKAPLELARYIKDLPVVTVKGKSYRFINGIGYGIDGYCCEVGDKLRATSTKPVNYTSIAIKGLLFYYRPTNAVVTVDGRTYEYKKVWIAPAMHGRFYGGGMMPAPEQNRLSEDGKLSLMLMHNGGKLRILTIFPSLFKGAHLNHKKQSALHTGHDITVRFDRPVALQIDGETILNVTEYRAQSAACFKEERAGKKQESLA